MRESVNRGIRQAIGAVLLARMVAVGTVASMASTVAATGAEGRIAADNYLYTAHNVSSDDSTRQNQFEDWAALSLVYGDFEANMVYEAHLPPPDWSGDTTGHGIYERWVTWRRRGLSLTAGTFYALLGKGITFKSLRNRDLRYNGNLDGLELRYGNGYIDFTAFNGRQRDFAGSRSDPLAGAELRITPARFGNIGFTAVQSPSGFSGNTAGRGSGYVRLRSDRVSVYAELAAKEIGRVRSGSFSKHPLGSGGTALYVTADALAGDFSLLCEAAQYDSFDFSEVRIVQSRNVLAMPNNPPPALKEHVFSLMNRAQPVVEANHHTAIHTEVRWAQSDENNVTCNISRAVTGREVWSRRSEPFLRCLDIAGDSSDARGVLYPAADYSDMFIKGEFVAPEVADWVVGTGYQQAIDARHFNFVATGDYGLADNYSVQGGFEHQWSIMHYSRRSYFSQLYTLGVASASAPRLSLTLFDEVMVEPVSGTRDRILQWPGVQVSWTFRERHELTVFAGKRKKGKICAGGVCVNKPEFSGMEVILTSRW